MGRIFILQGKPSDIPYSKVLLLLGVIGLFSLKNLANLWFVEIIQTFSAEDDKVIYLSMYGSSLIVGMSILILFASIGTILNMFNMQERMVQVTTCMLGVDMMLTLLFIVWIAGLYFAPIPLESNSFYALTLILSFILMLYWQFMIYIHVFHASFDVSMLQSGLFALIYMLLQHNIAEFLMNLVIRLE